MSFDANLGNQDPTAGDNAGADGSQGDQSDQTGTQPEQQTPAERTYRQSEFDSHMAGARRSWEAQAQRERAAIEQRIRQEYEQRQQRPANDPWSSFDPNVAQALRQALAAELDQRITPMRDQQEDLTLRNEESAVSAKYRDYAENRNEILEFAVANGIPNVEVAYHAWRSQNRWQDPDAIGKAAVAAYTKRKIRQSDTTPSVEGRGGGAPTSARKIKDFDDADEAAKELFRASQEA